MAEPEWQALANTLRPFIRSRVAGDADADDVLQEVLLRMHRGIGRLRDEERVAPWMYRIARNAVADHLRARARHPIASADGVPEEAAPDADGESVAEEVARYVAAFVDLLPPPYREAIRLTELEGLKQREAAERLGVPLSTMKSWVQRGRAKLRVMLEACCEIALDTRNHVIGCEPRTVGDCC